MTENTTNIGNLSKEQVESCVKLVYDIYTNRTVLLNITQDPDINGTMLGYVNWSTFIFDNVIEN